MTALISYFLSHSNWNIDCDYVRNGGKSFTVSSKKYIVWRIFSHVAAKQRSSLKMYLRNILKYVLLK